jgi:hypothetical protein
MNHGMRWTATIIGCLVVWSGTSLADESTAEPPGTLEGQVAAVDMAQGKLTIRSTDGSMHEFQASPETLRGYKVGDPIKAKPRTSATSQPMPNRPATSP